MQTLITKKTDNKCLTLCPKLRRQTHMHCSVCEGVAEFYDQVRCHNCGSCYKWSVPWKNDEEVYSE